MRNLLITMSGGTTSVINATLAGIISSAQQSPHIDKIYAGFPGILGFLAGKVLDLTDTTAKQRDIITYSPGSASIGTTRTKIFSNDELDILKDSFLDQMPVRLGFYHGYGRRSFRCSAFGFYDTNSLHNLESRGCTTLDRILDRLDHCPLSWGLQLHGQS